MGNEEDKRKKIKVIEEMQKVVEQMRLDDIEENPDTETELFDCSCCGKTSCLAGSIQYDEHRLCNDCVLLAEVGFQLKQLNSIQDLIDSMEDKRLEEICDYIKEEENKLNN